MKTEKLPRAKLNTDTLCFGRTASTNPTLWKGKPPQLLDDKQIKAAADEIVLLSLLKDFPGRTAKWYTDKLKTRNYLWVVTKLRQYREDKVVRAEILKPKEPYRWYLHE